MTFSANGVVCSVESINEKFVKVLLQDERKQHVVVNIPVDEAIDVKVGWKVSIWGNVSAFNYQSKWYNNLFAQTVVPEHKKYILVRKVEEKEGQVSFDILEYRASPFNVDEINERYPSTLPEQQEPKQEVETAKSLLKKKLLQFTANSEKLKTIFFNLEYWHLQNALANRRVIQVNAKISMNEHSTYFSKREVSPKHDLLYFKEEEVVTVSVSDVEKMLQKAETEDKHDVDAGKE